MEWIIDQFSGYRSWLEKIGVKLCESVLILIIGWWLVNVLSKAVIVFFRKTCSDNNIASFTGSFLKFFLRIVLLVSALGHIGMDIRSFVAAIGASFVAVGLSLKDRVANVVSGIILVITKPIHIGDYIEFDNVVGTVVRIDMFYTTIQTSEKDKIVIIPNSKLISNNITRKSDFNITTVESNLKTEFNDNYDEWKKFFEKEFLLNKNILQVPEPVILISVTNENSLEIKVTAWCHTHKKGDVKRDMLRIFDKLRKKYKLTTR